VELYLTIRTPRGRAGCISDGRSWEFYYLRKATFGRGKDKIEGHESFVHKGISARSNEEIIFVFDNSLITAV
jgi:hypothetical protein